MSNVLEKVVDLTTLNIMRTTRAMLMNFALLIPQDVRFLFGCAKYCACFSKLFYEKVKGNIIKRQETSAFKPFSLPKNGLHGEIMFPPQFTTSLKVT